MHMHPPPKINKKKTAEGPHIFRTGPVSDKIRPCMYRFLIVKSGECIYLCMLQANGFTFT